MRPVHPTTGRPLRRRAVLGVLGMGAAVVLTACGAAHPGAAAVVGGERITTAALDSHLTAYRSALAATAGTDATEGSGLVRHTLQLLVESELVDDELAAKGLSVSPAEVQQARAAAVQQTGSEAALEQAFLQQVGLAPGDIDTYFRMTVGEQKLLRASGVDPNSPQATPAITAILNDAAKHNAVTVNPRYGAWNARAAAVGAYAPSWLKPSA